jgi:hypothetical protein
VTAPIAAAATDSLTVTSAATYTLVPARSVVRVVVDVTAEHKAEPRLRGRADALLLRRLPDRDPARGASVRATSNGATVGTTNRPQDGYSELEVRFPRRSSSTRSRRSASPSTCPAAPRSKSEVRVGPAFATFAAWAFGESGSVRIVIPAGFEAETSGSDVVRSTSGSGTVFTSVSVTDVPSWDVTVNADRTSALTSARIDLPDGEHLVVHAWPDDPSWGRDVTELLSNGLPKLVDETGLTWPVSGDLEVFEVHTPLLEGYAGIFYEGENRIEISEDLDDLTILHEASHAWFNNDLFDGRWINEGFADTFASRTLDAIGLGGWTPNPVSPTQAAAVRLNDWTFPGRIADDQTDAHEAYGYDAAWTVVRTIASELGPDRMRAVLEAAEARQIAYAGAGTPEAVLGRTDWRRLLDLFDERGGSRTADIFRRWVVNDAQRATSTRDRPPGPPTPGSSTRATAGSRRCSSATRSPAGGSMRPPRGSTPRTTCSSSAMSSTGWRRSWERRRPPTCGPPIRRRRPPCRPRRRSRRARSPTGRRRSRPRPPSRRRATCS